MGKQIKFTLKPIHPYNPVGGRLFVTEPLYLYNRLFAFFLNAKNVLVQLSIIKIQLFDLTFGLWSQKSNFRKRRKYPPSSTHLNFFVGGRKGGIYSDTVLKLTSRRSINAKRSSNVLLKNQLQQLMAYFSEFTRNFYSTKN